MEREESERLPVFTEDGITFIFIKCANLYFLATTKRNSNVLLMFTFLYKLVEVFEDYFGEIEEEAIRDNFVIIYELLDETMDFGYPQTCEARILREVITQESNRLESVPKPPLALTNTVSWRPEGIVHRKNEVFLDVVERLNLLLSSTGQVLHSEIVGAVQMRTFLSGMPELKLGLNDKVMFDMTGRNANSRVRAVELDDIRFHQCVRLARFQNDRTISFIPPDGDFDLMTYRLNSSVKPLILVETVINTESRSRLELMVKIKSQFKSRSIANNVEIIIPVPEDVDTPQFKAGIGTVVYYPDSNTIHWSIKQFAGGKEYLMRAQFGLPSISSYEEEESGMQRHRSTSTSGKEEESYDDLHYNAYNDFYGGSSSSSSSSSRALSWKQKPVRVRFEIPYFTVSGIQVRYLKIIERSGYQALPWVRYITMDGEYQVRMS